MFPFFNIALPLVSLVSIAFAASILSTFVRSEAAPAQHLFPEIDGLRGIAAVVVMMNHLPASVFGIGDTVPAHWGITKDDLWTFANLGSTGVRVFFCITGFLFWQRLKRSQWKVDWKSFYLRRAARIVPAYTVFALLVSIAAFAVGGTPRWGSIPQVSREVFQQFSFGFLDMSHINGVRLTFFNAVAWTLAHEWRFYLCLPLLVALRSNRALILLALSVLGYWTFVYDPAYYILQLFLAGMLAAELFDKLPRLERRYANLVFVALLGASLAVNYMEWPDALDHVYTSVLTFAIFACAVFARPSLLRNRLLAFLGAISYSLYLMHLLVIQTALRIANAHVPVATWTVPQFFAFCAASAFLSVVVATVCYRCVELPFMRRHSVLGKQARADATTTRLN